MIPKTRLERLEREQERQEPVRFVVNWGDEPIEPGSLILNWDDIDIEEEDDEPTKEA